MQIFVKTLTSKTSSLQPVGCISDQFPTRGTLAREVSASHEKSPPHTRSLRLARQVRLQLVRGSRHTAQTSPPTRVEERISMSRRNNSWRPCRQPTPARALMQIWPAARPSHRHHLPLCHTQDSAWGTQAPSTTRTSLDLGSGVAS
jgi:hypothetical protein